MGLYSHYTTQQLTDLRDRLSVAHEQQLTSPSSASGHGRSVQFRDTSVRDLQKQISDINDELTRRSGKRARRPIYLVG